MPTYRTPGVSFEWLDLRQPGLIPLRTDIAGFVGIAARGPLHSPRKVESWTQFLSLFGGHTAQGFLAYAVEGFFANGGDTCWVVRVADPEQARCARATLVDAAGWPILALTARSEGTWAHDLSISAIPGPRNRFTLTLRLPDGTREIWPNLSPLETDSRYALAALNDAATGSLLVVAAEPVGWPAGATVTVGGEIGRMSGGADGLWSLDMRHVSGAGAPPDRVYGLAALETVDQVSMVAIPDLMIEPAGPRRPRPRPPAPGCEDLSEQAADALFAPAPESAAGSQEFAPPFAPSEIAELQRELVGHCEKLRDRIAILDAQPVDRSVELVLQRRRDFGSAFAALYYPWLRVTDPLELDGPLRAVPPSGHIAGIFARGDLRIGVHKPPANEEIEQALDVTDALDDFAHGELNDGGVNAIRAYPGRGVRVMGARTLSREPEWRYINVRRLLSMIEETVDEQVQWAVFEPNSQDLWRDVDRSARNFLDGLWRLGMLDGVRAEDAYQVTCDETTNPPWETDLGRLTCLIGVQPPLPAEFVIVRVGRDRDGQRFTESKGVPRGRDRQAQRPVPRLSLRDPDQRSAGGWL